MWFIASLFFQVSNEQHINSNFFIIINVLEYCLQVFQQVLFHLIYNQLSIVSYTIPREYNLPGLKKAKIDAV